MLRILIFALCTTLLGGCITQQPLVVVSVGVPGASNVKPGAIGEMKRKHRLEVAKYFAKQTKDLDRARKKCAKDEEQIAKKWKEARRQGRKVAEIMKLEYQKRCGLPVTQDEILRACEKDRKTFFMTKTTRNTNKAVLTREEMALFASVCPRSQ